MWAHTYTHTHTRKHTKDIYTESITRFVSHCCLICSVSTGLVVNIECLGVIVLGVTVARLIESVQH